MIAHILGLDDATGGFYLFWSGIGANLPLLGGLWVFARKHNCHVRRCLRVGRHHVEGTTYVVCRRHHPEDGPTEAELQRSNGGL